MKKICVVIPARNESKHIEKVVKDVKKIVKNVIIVDDGSEDNTPDIAAKAGVTVLKHILNTGKGAALKTGCDFAYNKGFDIFIVMDADGQHEAKEIPNFLTKLKDKDIVFGHRTFDKNMPLVQKLGNSIINRLTKILYNVDLKDTQCGFRAFTRETYKKIRWVSNDYSMESEMIANAGKNHLKYGEVPIRTIYLEKYKGTTLVDGLKIVLNMIAWRFKR